MVLKIIFRILLLGIALGIGLFFFPFQIHDFIVNTLGYKNPPGFFGFTWADWDIAWIAASSLWVGIILGTLGKKIDYIFIIGFFILASLNDFYTQNMTWLVYSALVYATILGNLIGFVLKLIRLRLFPQ